jgi:anti-sigma B factor antagonist
MELIPSSLTVAVQHLDGHADILLIGELDASSVRDLRNGIQDLIAQGHRDLRLNLSALSFCDAGGLGALIELREQLVQAGGGLTLHHVRGIVLRLLTVCGVSDTFAATAESIPAAADPSPESTPQAPATQGRE